LQKIVAKLQAIGAKTSGLVVMFSRLPKIWNLHSLKWKFIFLI